MGLIMGSQNIMGSDYGSNISAIAIPNSEDSQSRFPIAKDPSRKDP